MPQEKPTPRPPGRLRAAWYVLLGQRLTPLQIEAEWLEFKLIFEDILTRFGAQLARNAQSEKKRINRELEPDSREPAVHVSPKAAVRSRIAAARGIAGPTKLEFPHATEGEESA